MILSNAQITESYRHVFLSENPIYSAWTFLHHSFYQINSSIVKFVNFKPNPIQNKKNIILFLNGQNLVKKQFLSKIFFIFKKYTYFSYKSQNLFLSNINPSLFFLEKNNWLQFSRIWTKSYSTLFMLGQLEKWKKCSSTKYI